MSGKIGAMALLSGAAVTATTKQNFTLTGEMVPATISCSGVAASGEDIEIQKLVSNAVTPADADFATIKEAGASKVLNGDNNVHAIYSPGVYRIKTADVSYASGDVTVVVEY